MPNTFIHHQAAANAPDVPSLTLSPDVLSVANARGRDEIFLGQGKCSGAGKITLLALIKIMINVSAVNPVTDTERFTKKIVLSLSLSRFLCESVQVTQGRERREAI